ncbi:MAG: hypothetical protein U9P12_02340 [Verrucomicrobiota bacterium]|nr:hypothetical protein [Verrucomicrobiota bacterium]
MTEFELQAKLRKIEALFAGATFDGERAAAGEALKRMMERLEASRQEEPPIEMQFSLSGYFSKKLFQALLRRYELKPYRYKRQKYTTVMVQVPERFVNEILWPEFQELDKLLNEHLMQITEKIIRENICSDLSEVSEVQQLSG